MYIFGDNKNERAEDATMHIHIYAYALMYTHTHNYI